VSSIIKKISYILIWLPSILLLFGCVYLFYANNFVSLGFSLVLPILFILNVIIGVYWLINKNKLVLFSVFCGLIYFLCFDSFFQFNSEKKIDTNNEGLNLNTISFLTYNAGGFSFDDGIRDNNNKERVSNDPIVKFIINENPDIFCIQEFSAIKFKYFKDHPHWYKTNIFTQNKSVLALFSKYPIIDKGYIEFPDSTNGAMYVDLDINDEQVRVYNIHLESFKVRGEFYNFREVSAYKSLKSTINKAEEKRLEQIYLVKKHMETFNGKVIVCGDFNTTQFSFTYQLLKGSKKDTFIERGFGFGATYVRRGYPFRIDYILVDEDIKVISHKNFDLKYSDHEPILSELVIN